MTTDIAGLYPRHLQPLKRESNFGSPAIQFDPFAWLLMELQNFLVHRKRKIKFRVSMFVVAKAS